MYQAKTQFDYQEAFSKNLGLLTREEQEKIRNSTVAIAAMGGVGSNHMISFVRQGFQDYRTADPDNYELVNFNRQYGATLKTIGQPKVQVMKQRTLEINPMCSVRDHNYRLNKGNLEEFLRGADLAIDGIDCWEVDARRAFMNKAYEMGIPIISAGPIGFSAAYLIFMPKGKNKSPSPDKYFDWNDSQSYDEKFTLFVLGVIPSALQRKYMSFDDKRFKQIFIEHQGPSSIGAVDICAGVTLINALNILLGKGEVKAVPYYHQFDAMANKYVCKKLWFGNRGPIQQIKKHIILQKIKKLKGEK